MTTTDSLRGYPTSSVKSSSDLAADTAASNIFFSDRFISFLSFLSLIFYWSFTGRWDKVKDGRAAREWRYLHSGGLTTQVLLCIFFLGHFSVMTLDDSGKRMICGCVFVCSCVLGKREG